MRCYNCGYINFQRGKKCPSCNTTLKGTQSHVELAEDPTFTVFAGEPPDFGSGYDSDAALDEEFGVEQIVSDEGDFGLDLDGVEGADAEFGEAESVDADFGEAVSVDADFGEAESVDADFGESEESAISAGMASDVGPNDFELDLSEAIAEQIMASSAPMPADDSVEMADAVVDDDVEVDLDVDAEADDDLDLDLEPTVAAEADDDLDLDLEPTVAADAGTDLDIEAFGFADEDDAGEPEAVEVATDDLDLDLGPRPGTARSGCAHAPRVCRCRAGSAARRAPPGTR